jgi:hypothetical protein
MISACGMSKASGQPNPEVGVFGDALCWRCAAIVMVWRGCDQEVMEGGILVPLRSPVRLGRTASSRVAHFFALRKGGLWIPMCVGGDNYRGSWVVADLDSLGTEEDAVQWPLCKHCSIYRGAPIPRRLGIKQQRWSVKHNKWVPTKRSQRKWPGPVDKTGAIREKTQRKSKRADDVGEAPEGSEP